MKKWLCLLLAGVLTFSLAACGRGQNTDASGGVTDPTASNTDKTTEQTDPTSPSKGQIIQVAEPFASVLNSKKSFYFENEGKSVLLSDYYTSVWKLTSVDIDHDGNKEIAVMFDVDGGGGGTLVLWQDGTSVYGYEFGFREMYRLNKDGTFLWNTNSGNTYGCSSIAFEGTKVKTTEVWRIEHNEDSFTYYIDNKPVLQEQMNAFAQYRDLEEVDWIVFSSDTTIVGSAEEWKEPNKIDVSDAFVAVCNMNAGGYVNFLNGKYYYLDTENRNRLFMSDADGKNAVCIDSCTDATLSHITAGETAVYYLKSTKLDTPLEFNNSSVLYSVSFEGQLRRFCDGEVTVLSKENVVSYALSKEYIFYTTADLKVYRIKHDGTEKKAIFDLQIPMNVTVSGEKLYVYADETIISTDFDGKNSFTSRLYMYAGAFNESVLYFVDLNGYSLWKTELSDKDTYAAIDNMQRVTDGKIRSYTVYNGRLVYEKMHTDEIVIADMDGKNPKVVCSGKSPIALNGHLFYLDNGVIRVADI